MSVLETYTPTERKEILRHYRKLIEVWHTRKNRQDLQMVKKAFVLAADAHKDMRRKTGEPYIFHPLEVATIAAGEIGLGRTSIICALLHDVVEDTEYSLEDISAMFGEQIARIIDGLTKIDSLVEGGSSESMQAENFRKVILTLSLDVRVILIKLADRLHNMRTLNGMPVHKQLKIASETSYLYIPLAYRLGLYAIKSELEDLTLKYTEPTIYESIRKSLEESRTERNNTMDVFLEPIKEKLQSQGVTARIIVAEKSISSIWSRMKSKQISFSDVHDAYVIRFIVDSTNESEKVECWRVYTLIASTYKLNSSQVRDYISLPKANGYESLHVTVMGKTGRWVEIQIRSQRMDDIAEKGYAADWKYKKSPDAESGLDEWIAKVNELSNIEGISAVDYVNNFKLNLFSSEIHVFTRTGEMLTLPKNATALDFAFNLHTNLGSKSIGANINQQLVPLNHKLNNGDQVEILTSKTQYPKEEWFQYVVTARAKTKLTEAIREYRKTFKNAGQEKLENYFKSLNLEVNKANISTLIQAENLGGLADLYYYVAIDRINLAAVKNAFRKKPTNIFFKYLVSPFVRYNSIDEVVKKDVPNKKLAPVKVNVVSKDNISLDYIVSTCCNPIPGDNVVALALPNEPMHIHRVNCPDAIDLMSQYGNNIIKAKWKQKEGIVFLTGIKIKGIDSVGFIHRITEVISVQLKLNIRNLQFESSEGVVFVFVTVYVQNAQNLEEMIEKLRKVEGVRKVTRLDRIDEGQRLKQ